MTTTKPGSATHPLPGIAAMIVDEQGDEVPRGGGGYLVLQAAVAVDAAHALGRRRPLRARPTGAAFGRDVYFTGDGAKTDEDGDFWLLGRVDDVINVAGHRISTTEVESASCQHPAVAEAAAIGAHDAIKGEQIAAFVITRDGVEQTEELRSELLEHVATQIGKFARPGMLLFTPDLPKTRSGKIMRRLLQGHRGGPRARRRHDAARPGDRPVDQGAGRPAAGAPVFTGFGSSSSARRCEASLTRSGPERQAGRLSECSRRRPPGSPGGVSRRRSACIRAVAANFQLGRE